MMFREEGLVALPDRYEMIVLQLGLININSADASGATQTNTQVGFAVGSVDQASNQAVVAAGNNAFVLQIAIA